MNELVNGAVSIAIAIVGVALLAVLVSRNAQTPQVISAGGDAFARALAAATGPVMGGGGYMLGGGAYSQMGNSYSY